MRTFFLFLCFLNSYSNFVFIVIIFLAPLNPCSNLLVWKAQAPVPGYWDGCGFTEQIMSVFECRLLSTSCFEAGSLFLGRRASEGTLNNNNRVWEKSKTNVTQTPEWTVSFLSPR